MISQILLRITRIFYDLSGNIAVGFLCCHYHGINYPSAATYPFFKKITFRLRFVRIDRQGFLDRYACTLGIVVAGYF